MYIKVIPICWQWQQSCSSERDALFSLVLQGNEYWAYEVSATVRWLTLSQTQAGHIWGYVLCMSYRIPIRTPHICDFALMSRCNTSALCFIEIQEMS